MQRGMADSRFRFLQEGNELTAITMMHWMMYLAAAVRCGGAVGEVSMQVRDFFSEVGAANRRIQQLAEMPGFPLPEIREVFGEGGRVFQ